MNIDLSYELSNHLGNVLAVVSDRKFAVGSPLAQPTKTFTKQSGTQSGTHNRGHNRDDNRGQTVIKTKTVL